jgi:hypothetical protein
MSARIKDALYNTHQDSGAAESYGQGIVIGIVSVLMAAGVSFAGAMNTISDNLPSGYRVTCIPPEWRDHLRR